ncbi:MAG: FlgD immunoglobulin-like domain containing protein, partial [Candidatus Cloacimonadaceae bacterium]
SNLPGTGLIVYRLFPEVIGNADGPPDELYIYRPYANNTTTNGSLSSAHFSAQVNRTKINESTVPNGFMNDNSPGGLNIYNIGFAGDTITFDVRISDVQLTAPQANEVWFAGTHKQISWKRKSAAGTVKLEFSSDNGQSWSLIGNSISNSGNYTWVNVPYIDSNECFIRITLNSNGHQDTNVLPFSVISGLNIPNLIYPEAYAANIPTNPTFEWEAVIGATGYYFQLADNLSFNPTLISLLDYPQSTYSVTGLAPYTTYYWRVAAASVPDFGAGLFSDTFAFTTGSLSEVPSIPSLVSPPNMASNLPRNPTLVWNSCPLAEYYRLQISADPYFNTLTVYQDEIYGTSFIPEPLEAHTAYFWRVAAVNNYAASNYSGMRRFSTGNTVDNNEDISPVLQNKLSPNHPNPFKATTNIGFSLKNPNAWMSLSIYNTKGQKVRTLYSGIAKSSRGEISWDGEDDQGNALSSGVYLYRLESKDYQETRKLLLTK